MEKKKPKGDSYYGKRAANYEKRRLKQDWWHVEQREMRALLDGLPRDLKVVDIPFGTGRFVPYYVEFGYNIHGLDASDQMLGAAKDALGALYKKCSLQTGDAAHLPFVDGEFDLLVSTRFLRDIVVYEAARKMLAEFSRVTSRYAIIQLGEDPSGHADPDEDEVMGSRMSRAAVDTLLQDIGLRVLDRRLVLENIDGGDIHHILCEKT